MTHTNPNQMSPQITKDLPETSRNTLPKIPHLLGAKVLHIAEALTLREGTTDQLSRGVRDAGAEGFGIETCHGLHQMVDMFYMFYRLSICIFLSAKIDVFSAETVFFRKGTLFEKKGHF